MSLTVDASSSSTSVYPHRGFLLHENEEHLVLEPLDANETPLLAFDRRSFAIREIGAFRVRARASVARRSDLAPPCASRARVDAHRATEHS